MGWPTKYTGEEIDIALDKGKDLRIVNNGWIRLESSTSSPTNLNSLKNPGNYTTSFWTGGPDFGDEIITPINITITVINGDTHQIVTAGNRSYARVMVSGGSNYGNWSIDQSDGAINPGNSAPSEPID